MQNKEVAPDIFFDPFAGGDEEAWDAETAFDEIFARYANGKVEHNYTADMFVADTEAIVMDAHYAENLSAMTTIANRMHQLCNDDHQLQNAAQASGMLGKKPHSTHNHITYAHDEEKEDNSTPSTSRRTRNKTKTSSEQKRTRSLTFEQIMEFLKAWTIMPKRP
ncbi:MAG: hypothetical protein WBP26_02845 [Candidatus Saccharimonadales bacterium]